MGEGDEDRKLHDATIAALERAEEIGAATVALPAISTGIFGYPMHRCARVMLRAAREFEPRANRVRKITFCLFDEAALREFEKAREEMKE